MCPSGSAAGPRAIAAVVGVGPRLGRSIARKFAHEGYNVAILARDLGRLSRIAEEIAREEMTKVFAIRINCADARSVREAFEGVLSLGYVEVLVYNAAAAATAGGVIHRPLRFTDIRLDSFQTSLAVSSTGAFLCAQQVIPGMLDRGKGTILFTGSAASLAGAAGLCEQSCGKFALRALSQCLAREFLPQGIHVAHVVLAGAVGEPRSLQRPPPSPESPGEQSSGEAAMDPDAIAEAYWQVHVQERSAWTQEIDLRPWNQPFS